MGRPRKYPRIEESDENEVKIKKKRGRKPKIRTPEELAEIANRGKKKRGRKPKEKFNFDTKNKTNNRFEEDLEESIIVRLSLNNEDINKMENNNNYPIPFDPQLNLNPNQLLFSNISNEVKNDNSIINNKENNEITINKDIVNCNDSCNDSCNDNCNDSCNDNCNDSCNDNCNDKPNNALKTIEEENKILNKNIKAFQDRNIKFNNDDNFTNVFDTVKYKKDFNNRQISLLLKTKYNTENKIDLLLQLVHCNKFNKWPEKTNTSCFWCCHEFGGTPWGIPYKYEDNLFHLFGIFCSPNCCASYIFDESCNNNIKWERFSLLNLLYSKVYGEIEDITLAPSKLALKKFGGSMEIDEYRDKFKTKNTFVLKFPPLVSIIPVLDEINKNKINIKNSMNNKFIPVDKNRIKKANTELKLKRSKPSNINKNTLDQCMNINIIT